MIVYIPFKKRIRQLLDEKHAEWIDLSEGCGVCRQTIWRGVKNRSTLAALAYYFCLPVEELVDGTDVENIWWGEDL